MNQAAAARTLSGQIAVGVDGGGTRACVGERGHLDRLLIEPGPGVLRTSARDRGWREMAVGRFVFDQPGQQIQAALPQRSVFERNARGDHRLGEDGVRVGRVAARATARPRHRSVRRPKPA